jgi:hypothetical protein
MKLERLDMPGSFFELENRVGTPVRAGDYRLIPISRALILKFPGRRGGIIWNRPVSVVAQTEDGQEQLLPVKDVTRQVQLALLGGALLSTSLLWLVRRQVQDRRRSEESRRTQ